MACTEFVPRKDKTSGKIYRFIFEILCEINFLFLWKNKKVRE